MFNWHVGSIGISSVRQFSKHTVMDLWGSPLQGVFEFKTIFLVILRCYLLSSLLTFVLRVGKIAGALAWIKVVDSIPNCMDLGGVAGDASLTSKCLCCSKNLVLFNLNPWVFILIFCKMRWEVLTKALLLCTVVWWLSQRKTCVVDLIVELAVIFHGPPFFTWKNNLRESGKMVE